MEEKYIVLIRADDEDYWTENGSATTEEAARRAAMVTSKHYSGDVCVVKVICSNIPPKKDRCILYPVDEE